MPVIALAGLLAGGPARAAYGPQMVNSASVVEVGNTSRPEVVLTFDAGSDAGNTDGILTALRREDIRATFGLTGVWAEQNLQLARRIAREGHQIVNHTYDHRSFTGASDRTNVADTLQKRSEQLERAEAVFRSLGLTSSGWFRPPYGDVCRAGSAAAVCKSRGPGNVEADVARAGYSTELMWTVDTLGWNGVPATQVVQRTVSQARNGEVVLMHVGAASTDYAALPQVIRELRARGYGFATAGRAVTQGEIGSRYFALDGPDGLLGWPLTVELPTAIGGAPRLQHFRGGSVYWSPGTGAHEVHGAIRGHWWELRAEGGFLGLPKTDETTAPDGVGRFNYFSGGAVYWTAGTGAHEVHGAILDKWASLRWERGLLGYPLTDELTTPGGAGRYNVFQAGAIYWGPQPGAHEVYGALLARYRAEGGPQSALGLPTSDEWATPDGRRGDFQHGFIRWYAATHTTQVVIE